MTLAMIDESVYQARAWPAAALRSAGIKVVAVKATEGTTYVNPNHDWQVNEARAAGCVVMHYHLSHYSSSGGEADYFLTHAHVGPGDLVMNDNEANLIEALQPIEASAWVSAFTKDLRKLTRTQAVVQYTSRDPITRGYLDSVKGKEPLFVAEPGASPASPQPVPGWLISFLQYGTRSSSAGPTDADAAYFGSLAQVRKLGVPQGPAPGGPRMYQAGGHESLAELAKVMGTSVSAVLWETAQPAWRGRGFGNLEAAYLDAGDWAAPMPAGMQVWVP